MRSLAPHLPRVLVDLLGNGDGHNQSADHVSLRGLAYASRHVEPCRPVVVIPIGDRFRARAKLPSGLFRLQNIGRRLNSHSHRDVAPVSACRRLNTSYQIVTTRLAERLRTDQNLIFRARTEQLRRGAMQMFARPVIEFYPSGLRVEAEGQGGAQRTEDRGNVHTPNLPSHRAENKPGAPVVMAGAPFHAALHRANCSQEVRG